MAIVILGIALLILFMTVAKRIPELAPYAGLGRLLSIACIIGGILSAGIRQISPGEVGVKILFGNIQNDVLASGLHFINPLLTVKSMDVKTQNYKMSGIADEGGK